MIRDNPHPFGDKGPCLFYEDGAHAWETGFERIVGTCAMWAGTPAECCADDASVRAAKRCRCGAVVYERR